ncbi:hypothetical protein U9M48_024324, partial [Paspalum notatum var. saurae]
HIDLANEELPPDQPPIEEPEDEPEDPHTTADHPAAEAPSNPSGEGMEFLMCVPASEGAHVCNMTRR